MGLAADGDQVALVTTRPRRFRTERRCVKVVVWTVSSVKSRSFETLASKLPECGREETRPYTLVQLAIGDGQVAWIGQTGGNDVELHLEAAKLIGRAAKEVDFETWSGDGRGGRFGPLLGGGPLLVYNSWALACEAMSCPPQKLRLVDVALARISAGHRRVVKKGRDSHRLAAVGGRRMAVERAGAVKVLTPTGSVVATVRAVRRNPPRAIALSRARLVVERMHTLDLYGPATGRRAKSISLGPAASLRLVAVNSKLALLRGRHRLVLVRLSDGKRTKLPVPPTRIVGATLTTAGLFYARNTRRTAPRGRVTFEPTAALLARF